MNRILLLIVVIVIGIAVFLGFRITSEPEQAAPAPVASVSTPAAPLIQAPARVDAARIIAADSEPQNWLTHGRTYSEQRFSPLTSITDQNVARLGLAWYVDLDSKKGIEATPLVIDGVMYTTGIWNTLHAYNAVTGAQLWTYDPKVPRTWLRNQCCGLVNRGPAAWDGKIIAGTLDGRLIAVDAGTGTLVWEVQTTDTQQPYSITGAPRIVNGKVIIGNGGADYGVRGYVTAYDAQTGAQIWRFHTVPGDPANGFESPAMEMAAKTWSGQWWTLGGGGTAWDSFAFDPELNLLYIGTGNGSPWPRDIRSPGGGDNLFLSSIVAVNADTGEYAWHYQTVPGENWDYTATQSIILADIQWQGTPRKVLMQAPKNGFFYVIDRASGELLSARGIVPTNWASHVDMATGRPVEIAANALTEIPKAITPGPNGAHDWQPMAFSPLTGLAYFPAHEMWWAYSKAANFTPRAWLFNPAQSAVAPSAQDAALMTNGKGFLLAWDPVNERQAWRVELGRGWDGGVLATAGNLLFQGASDGRFVAYRADTGAKLWEMPIRTGAVAGPISYAVDGEQYIAIAAGWGGSVPLMGATMGELHHENTRILAFRLDGTAQLPAAAAAAAQPIPAPPPLTATPELVARGEGLYNMSCGNCHGFSAIAGGTIRDLRHMQPATHAIFKQIVLDGVMRDLGMASFADVYSEADVEAIHAFVIKRANDDYAP